MQIEIDFSITVPACQYKFRKVLFNKLIILMIVSDDWWIGNILNPTWKKGIIKLVLVHFYCPYNQISASTQCDPCIIRNAHFLWFLTNSPVGVNRCCMEYSFSHHKNYSFTCFELCGDLGIFPHLKIESRYNKRLWKRWKCSLIPRAWQFFSNDFPD